MFFYAIPQYKNDLGVDLKCNLNFVAFVFQIASTWYIYSWDQLWLQSTNKGAGSTTVCQYVWFHGKMFFAMKNNIIFLTSFLACKYFEIRL